jgi:hypothetical protein
MGKLVVSPKSVTASYAFMVSSLMFGLPLLVSYYGIQQSAPLASLVIAGYAAASAVVGVALLLMLGNDEQDGRRPGQSTATHGGVRPIPLEVLALLAASAGVILFASMRYLLAASYPYPSAVAGTVGEAYIASVAVAALLGFPALVTSGFGVVRNALHENGFRLLAFCAGAAYFLTYEIMVNEIVITGYNAPPGNFVPSPAGYPALYVFTSGPSPSNPLEMAIYVPYVLVQLNDTFNFIFQPFEIIFAVLLSTLVAANIVATLHRIKLSSRIGGACSTAATVSGIGAFLGYTATCPSCLAPTLVSVIFGGFSGVQAAFSNLYGAILPPLVSTMALSLSLLVLNRGTRAGVKRDQLHHPLVR